LKYVRMSTLRWSTGMVAMFSRNLRHASLWKRYCSTFDV